MTSLFPPSSVPPTSSQYEANRKIKKKIQKISHVKKQNWSNLAGNCGFIWDAITHSNKERNVFRDFKCTINSDHVLLVWQ